MKQTNKLFPVERSEKPMDQNLEEPVEELQKEPSKRMEMIVMQNFGNFKQGQIVLEQHLIDHVLNSPQKRFVRIRKGK